MRVILIITVMLLGTLVYSEEKRKTLPKLMLPAKALAKMDKPTTNTAISISRIEPLLHEPPLPPTAFMDQNTSTTTSTLNADASTTGTTETLELKGAIRGDKILVNQASIEELVKFLSLDHNRAKNIVQYRKIVGEFESIHDLKKVYGMNEVLIKKSRKKLLYKEPEKE